VRFYSIFLRNGMKKKIAQTLGAATLAALLLVLAGPALPALVARASGGPTLSIVAPITVPGANVTVSGSGFAAGETVHVSMGAVSVDATADGSGDIAGALVPIPKVPAGLQFVSAFGETSGRWSLSYLWVAGYNPTVTPNTWYVLPGQAVPFSGMGFAPHESIIATYGGTAIGSSTTDASGNFTLAGVALPLSLHNTTATITFTGATSNASTNVTLTIGSLFPSITPSSWYASPGGIISVAGSGFAPHEGVVVSDAAHTASTTADASGSFTLGALALPATGGATAHITATGAQSGAVASADITLAGLSPWLTFSSYWAQGGSPLTILGNGFAGNESVHIYSGSQTLGITTTNGSGSFSFAGAVPFAPSGPTTITATGLSSGATGTGNLTVAPVYTDFHLGAYSVTRGSAVELIGHGYLANEPVNITTSATGSTVVATVTADSGGNFDDSSYIIPASTTPGNLTITATSVHSFDVKSVTLYVGS
jgi:hypothetical protein